MKVYRISKCEYIDDLTGTGAALYGGRWNSKGTYVLYTAATPSLALLESVVHISNIPAVGYCMITLEVPDGFIHVMEINDLPANWQIHPPPAILRKTGDQFVLENKYLALKLPSAIMPEDYNYLINPAHPDSKKIKMISKRKVPIDDRLKK